MMAFECPEILIIVLGVSLLLILSKNLESVQFLPASVQLIISFLETPSLDEIA